ncbi:hypothetical protein Hanom_Chr06g00508581 [Helianthus anomalus]
MRRRAISRYLHIFFGEGNFWLPTTHFFGAILSHYHFHVSQLSLLGMVRIRHF